MYCVVCSVKLTPGTSHQCNPNIIQGHETAQRVASNQESFPYMYDHHEEQENDRLLRGLRMVEQRSCSS